MAADESVTATRRRLAGGRLTVQHWFLLLLLGMGILVIACGGIGYVVQGQTTDASDRLNQRIGPARLEAFRLQAALLDQQAGVRGYLLTGERQFLDPYTRGVAAERAAVTRLTALIRAERQPTGDLRVVQQAAAAWRRSYAEPVLARVGEEGEKSVPASMVAQGNTDFELVRGHWDELSRDLDAIAADGRSDLAANRKVRDWAFIAMLGGFVLSGVLLAVIMTFAVARPLRRLAESSRRVADGDFDHEITGHGPADLRALAADVEAMRIRIVRELTAATEREGLLRKQADDLDAQTAELRRSNAELEQFAYVASHDLQEPLRKITSFCQLLSRRYGDTLDERGQQYVGFAVDGAKRMQILINDLLTFSRVGRLLDERRKVPLGESLDEAVANLQNAVEETGTRIERPDGDKLPTVIGDPTLLTMLWQNLLGNAMKFRAPDRSPVVTVEVAEQDGGWEVAVTDNGIGISAEFADKIFVIFQRLHTRDVYEGTGIGLALCKKIVEYHGGRIWLDAEHTGGARIRFTLPHPQSDPDSEPSALAAQGATA